METTHCPPNSNSQLNATHQTAFALTQLAQTQHLQRPHAGHVTMCRNHSPPEYTQVNKTGTKKYATQRSTSLHVMQQAACTGCQNIQHNYDNSSQINPSKFYELAYLLPLNRKGIIRFAAQLNFKILPIIIILQETGLNNNRNLH